MSHGSPSAKSGSLPESLGVPLALSPTSTYPRLDSVSRSLKLSAIAMDRAIKGSFFCTEPSIWERSGDTTVPGHTVVLLTTGHHGCQSSRGFGKERRQQGLRRVTQCKDTVSHECPKLVMVERAALLCSSQAHAWRPLLTMGPGLGIALGHPSAKLAKRGAGIPVASKGQSGGEHRLQGGDFSHHSLVHLGATLSLQAGLEPLGHTVSCSLGWLNPLLNLGAEKWDWRSHFVNHGHLEAISPLPSSG